MRMIATLAVIGAALYFLWPGPGSDVPGEASARASGTSAPSGRFLGNTYDRPAGALAHYKGHSTGSSFTVFDDHIHTTEDFGAKETTVPFDRVTTIEESGLVPGNLVIEYTNERGHPDELSFLLMSEADLHKADGARDVDRLRALLDTQRSKHRSRRS